MCCLGDFCLTSHTAVFFFVHIILFICCWIQCANILLSSFEPVFIKDTDLKSSCDAFVFWCQVNYGLIE